MLQAQFVGRLLQLPVQYQAVKTLAVHCSLHFTSLYFKSRNFSTFHFPFFTSLQLWTFSHHPLKTLHFSSHIKVCDLGNSLEPLQAVGSTVCHAYKAVFTDICTLFTGPKITIVTIPAQVAWSYLPVHYRLPCRDIFYHYVVMLVFENIRLCEWM